MTPTSAFLTCFPRLTHQVLASERALAVLANVLAEIPRSLEAGPGGVAQASGYYLLTNGTTEALVYRQAGTLERYGFEADPYRRPAHSHTALLPTVALRTRTPPC